MTVAFDENVQERDCTVLFKFNDEFDSCVTVIEVVWKLSCCVLQGQGIVNVPKPNRRASAVVKNPFLIKMAHKDFQWQKQDLKESPQPHHQFSHITDCPSNMKWFFFVISLLREINKINKMKR